MLGKQAADAAEAGSSGVETGHVFSQPDSVLSASQLTDATTEDAYPTNQF